MRVDDILEWSSLNVNKLNSCGFHKLQSVELLLKKGR